MKGPSAPIMLVTGFGPFDDFEQNPSEGLARALDPGAYVLEVSYRAVEEFLDGLNPCGFDAMLMLGVAGGAEKLRIETVARNRIGASPDVRGEAWGPGPIDPMRPENLAATLWSVPELLNETDLWRTSVDAGSYLCNYVFFRALCRFPEKRIGFLHVVPYEVLGFSAQLGAIRSLVEACTGAMSEPVSCSPQRQGEPYGAGRSRS